MTPARSQCDTSEDDLRHAEACGKAFDLLLTRRVCLESYPYIADAHLGEAVDFLRSEDRCVGQHVKTPSALAPTVKANLLGNFLMAPTHAAEHLLRQATEPMIVFVNSALLPRTLNTNFPESLGAFFVRRLNAESNKILFNKSQHTVFIGGLGIECRTSPVYTWPSAASDGALIPEAATNFCYVFKSEEFIGGFLYLAKTEDGLTPLAVNAIGFKPTLHALAMKGGELHGKRIGLTDEAIRCLEGSQKQSDLHGHCQKRPVTVEELKKRGATHYAFVPPHLVCTDGSRFDSGPFGGFAYWLRNGETVYFAIEGTGEVLAHSGLPWDASVRCAMLPDSALEKDLKSRPRRGWWRTVKGSAQMTVARLRLKDPSHPVVLRGLAFATRREVFATVAAKAIAQLAFERARAVVCWDIVCRLASIACLIALVYQFRERILDKTLLYIMLALWARDALKASCLFVGYFRQGWFVDFLTSLQTIAEVIYLMAWLSMWMGLVPTDASELTHPMRALIAFLGTFSWMSLLHMLRGFSWATGLRIVPVFQTLWAVTDFLIIMMIFVIAGAHARFSLAPASVPIWQAVFCVYRLGFLGHFEVATDIEYATENATEDGEEPDLVPFQYLYFIVASFVVTIAMTNILIGAISRRFEYYLERSSDSLVKHQAWLGLDHALLDQGSSCLPCVVRLLLFGLVSHAPPGDHVLWCWYREEASLHQGTSVSTSVRRITDAVRDDVMAARQESAEKFDRLVQQVAALEKKPPRRRRGTPR